MAVQFEEEAGLFGPKEWMMIAAVVIAAYLYRTFHHLLPSTIGSPGNSSTQASVNDETRRTTMLEARRKLIAESEKKIEENRGKLKAREEQKRREQIERAEKLLDVNKKTSSSGASTSFRKEYNPLMGDEGSSSWRPSKKPSAKGG